MSALRQNTPDVLDRKVTKKGMAEKHTVGGKKPKKLIAQHLIYNHCSLERARGTEVSRC